MSHAERRVLDPGVQPEKGFTSIFHYNLPSSQVDMPDTQEISPYKGIIQPMFHSAESIAL
jgi:hypothetical protein